MRLVDVGNIKGPNQGGETLLETAAPRMALLQTGPCNLVSMPPTAWRNGAPKKPVIAPPVVKAEKR